MISVRRFGVHLSVVLRLVMAFSEDVGNLFTGGLCRILSSTYSVTEVDTLIVRSSLIPAALVNLPGKQCLVP